VRVLKDRALWRNMVGQPGDRVDAGLDEELGVARGAVGEDRVLGEVCRALVGRLLHDDLVLREGKGEGGGTSSGEHLKTLVWVGLSAGEEGK
jgi:hypothetical protein